VQKAGWLCAFEGCREQGSYGAPRTGMSVPEKIHSHPAFVLERKLGVGTTRYYRITQLFCPQTAAFAFNFDVGGLD